MGFTLIIEVTSIPDAERRHIEPLLECYLTVLAAMPETQRFDEYARAEALLLHYTRITRGDAPLDSTAPGAPVVTLLHNGRSAE